MAGKIALELKQTRPLSLEAEAMLNIKRTTSYLEAAVAHALKTHDLSSTQYNVLRILRGAGKAGLPCREIGERLVTREPDITRLLDRLEKRGLLGRSRESQDRRVITVRITDAGLAALKELDHPVEDAVRQPLRRLGTDRLAQLIEMLEEVRS